MTMDEMLDFRSSTNKANSAQLTGDTMDVPYSVKPPRPHAIREWTVASRLPGVLVGAAIGGAALGFLTTLERVIFHSNIYFVPLEIAVHGAAALFASMLGAVLIYPFLWCAIRIPAGSGVASPWRTLAVGGAVVGVVFGLLAYTYIIASTRFGALVAPRNAILVGSVVTGGSCAIGLAAFEYVLRRWTNLALILAALALGILIELDLHRYRAYGSVHLVVEACLLVAAGFLGSRTTLHLAGRRLASVGAGLLLLLASCAGLLMTTDLSQGARAAILQHGGCARSLFRHILWPLFDRDGDGFARLPLGTDCDDNNPNVNPLSIHPSSRYLGCRQPATPPLQATSQLPPQYDRRGKPKNLVWLVLDSLRSDVTQPHLRLFPGFVSFPNYRSCGSATRNAFIQLFGGGGCRPASLRGSIASELQKVSGHVSASFLEISPNSMIMSPEELQDTFGAFGEQQQLPNTGRVLDAAWHWISEQENKKQTHFAFIHLIGGHTPYLGQGSTDWERYGSSVGQALRTASDFVSKLSPDTIVVVMGDHGEEFLEHGGKTHALTLYEEVLAAPVLVRGTTLSPAEQFCKLDCSGLIGHIFEASSASEPRAIPEGCGPNALGQFASLDYPSTIPRGPIHIRSLQLPDGVKVIWNLQLDLWELYDLNKDSRETVNLAAANPVLLREAGNKLLHAMSMCSSGPKPQR